MDLRMVSDITDKLLPRIEEWQNRPLSAVYPIVFIDAVHFSVRDDGVIRKLAALDKILDKFKRCELHFEARTFLSFAT
ncbi:Transposase, Mutator family [Peptostreptococcaceae bacterium pGA-8]|nr:Transposase, Mutator family [Peptostreptococcaceae bacterium pGA-8]